MAEKEEEKKKVTKESWKKSKRIFTYLKPHRAMISVSLLLLAISAVLTLIITGILGQIAGTEAQSDCATDTPSAASFMASTSSGGPRCQV